MLVHMEAKREGQAPWMFFTLNLRLSVLDWLARKHLEACLYPCHPDPTTPEFCLLGI